MTAHPSPDECTEIHEATWPNRQMDLLDPVHEQGYEFDHQRVYEALAAEDVLPGLSEEQREFFDNVQDWGAPLPPELFEEADTVTVTEDKRNGPSWREFVNDADKIVEGIGAESVNPYSDVVAEAVAADASAGVGVWTGMNLLQD
jgi:hypothetical protein